VPGGRGGSNSAENGKTAKAETRKGIFFSGGVGG